MYIPKAFHEDDISQLHALMQQNYFAILVSSQDNTPLVTHLPVVLDTTRGPYGTVRSHMARANPHWRSFNTTQESLIIFQGPHSYITPSWYDNPLSVPTWNYAAVHAYGKPRIIEDVAEMLAFMEALTQQSESHFEQPWQLSGLPHNFLENMLRGTVCFTMEITRLEGKFKLSQNRPVSDRVRVADALQASPDPLAQGVASLMKERQEK